MLKLKKIHILGFKSFCDRTEVTVAGTGIAVVVGPNGCGKSNILDGVTWVLASRARRRCAGSHMQDLIFAGTRDRKALGMAEVTLTMIDPEAYEGPVAVEPEVVVDHEELGHEGPADWDEQRYRRQRAVEAEEIIANEQPGQMTEEEGEESPVPKGEGPGAPAGELESAASQISQGQGPQGVVLKIRRRKFQSKPQKGEVIITRRLFRTGESEYLLNGRLCRLRDIQDIFMGTGLGPESYAIIGQERIGQLLSSKPYERRAIIEEAAGVNALQNPERLRSCAWKARNRIWRAWTTSLKRSRADEQPEAPGGQGGALCRGARRTAGKTARGAGQPHGGNGRRPGASGAGRLPHSRSG